MIVELGHFLLIVSLGLAVLLSLLPLVGASRNNSTLMNTARPLSWGMFLLIMASFLVLLWAFYTYDFSVMYVATNSNSQRPCYYR